MAQDRSRQDEEDSRDLVFFRHFPEKQKQEGHHHQVQGRQKARGGGIRELYAGIFGKKHPRHHRAQDHAVQEFRHCGPQKPRQESKDQEDCGDAVDRGKVAEGGQDFRSCLNKNIRCCPAENYRQQQDVCLIFFHLSVVYLRFPEADGLQAW